MSTLTACPSSRNAIAAEQRLASRSAGDVARRGTPGHRLTPGHGLGARRQTNSTWERVPRRSASHRRQSHTGRAAKRGSTIERSAAAHAGVVTVSRTNGVRTSLWLCPPPDGDAETRAVGRHDLAFATRAGTGAGVGVVTDYVRDQQRARDSQVGCSGVTGRARRRVGRLRPG
jgi:hypothetical protein